MNNLKSNDVMKIRAFISDLSSELHNELNKIKENIGNCPIQEIRDQKNQIMTENVFQPLEDLLVEMEKSELDYEITKETYLNELVKLSDNLEFYASHNKSVIRFPSIGAIEDVENASLNGELLDLCLSFRIIAIKYINYNSEFIKNVSAALSQR